MAVSTFLLILLAIGVMGAALGSVGHPALVLALAWLRPVPPPKARGVSLLPKLSVIVPVHVDAGVLAEKCRALSSAEYPRDRLEIIVAADGDVAGIDDALAGFSGVRLLRLPRRGKPDTLNDAVAVASGDVVVISDRDAIPSAAALGAIAAALADDAVGGVCGNLTIGSGERAQRAYWNFENRLRYAEMRALGSLTSNSGALTAIRRELWHDIPRDVADDLFIALVVFLSGRRFIFAEEARVTCPARSKGFAEAMSRQARITVQSLNTLRHCGPALDPRRAGWFAVALICHKVLRRVFAGFVAMIVIAAVGLALAAGLGGWLGLAALLGVGVVGGAAVCLPRVRVVSRALWFVAAQLGMAIGVWRFVSGRRVNAW